MGLLLAQLRRDLLLALRSGVEAANPLVFFVLGVFLLGFGTDAFKASGAGAVWTLALFANVVAAEGMFQRDREDGALEQLLIHAQPLFPAIIGKLAAHWLVAGAPLVLLSPLAVFALQGNLRGSGALAASLLLGTPILAILGGLGAALTVGTGRGGLLLGILVMPWYLPVLVFGVGASTAAEAGGAAFPLLALAALLAASITLAPFAVGKSLMISQEY